MERFGSMYKSVGMPEDGDEKLMRESEACFDDPLAFVDDKEEMEKISRPMTPEEIRLHERADDLSNSILEKYGVEKFSVPEKNVLMVKRGQWPEEAGKDAGGLYNPETQLIALEETPIRMEYARNSLHEQIHFKSYNAMQGVQVEASESDKIYVFVGDYRMGLTIRSRDGKDTYFLNLNEAITEELVRRHADELFADPTFAEEKGQLAIMQRANNHMKEQGEDDGLLNEIDDPDTFYACLVPADSETGRMLKPDADPEDEVFYSAKFAYPEQRSVLQSLVEKIYTHNKEKFKDANAVFDEFAHAALSGRLLPLAKLVDSTFGSGAFRKIGEADPDVTELKAVVDAL